MHMCLQVLRPAAEANNAMWVVEFYSDRCPFCKSLSPEVVVAAERLAEEDPRVRVAAVNRCRQLRKWLGSAFAALSLSLSLSLCWCLSGSRLLSCFLLP
jgi:thiol-disulfide isomerase/thioredoxin